MANRPKFQVYYLASPSDPELPRWIDFQRCGEHRWRPMYENRDRLPDSRLTKWFRELNEEPLEVPLLGRNVSLDQKSAIKLCQFMVRETNRLATGDSDLQADFLLNERHPGGRGCGKQVIRIDADGTVKTWPSVTAAAKALGIVPRGIRERLQGHSHDAGSPIWA